MRGRREAAQELEALDYFVGIWSCKGRLEGDRRTRGRA